MLDYQPHRYESLNLTPVPDPPDKHRRGFVVAVVDADNPPDDLREVEAYWPDGSPVDNLALLVDTLPPGAHLAVVGIPDDVSPTDPDVIRMGHRSVAQIYVEHVAAYSARVN